MKETRESSIFDRARTISALDAAARFAGITPVRVGRRYKACCPIHNEKTPSCVFYENGTFYCFGCHAGGSSIDFTMAYYHETCTDAAKRIVREFNLGSCDMPDPAAFGAAKQRADAREALRRAASFTHAVQCAVIHWCDDQLAALRPFDDTQESEDWMETLLRLKIDAENLTDAINALEDANRTDNLRTLLTSVSKLSRKRYEMLKRWDETQGTCYVRGMRA